VRLDEGAAAAGQLPFIAPGHVSHLGGDGLNIPPGVLAIADEVIERIGATASKNPVTEVAASGRNGH
jgi:hypothetical protein